MDSNEPKNLDILLSEIEQEQRNGFIYDRTRIEEEVQQSVFRVSQLAVKVLTILGGLLASAMFLGFLATAGLYNSPVAMIVVGTVCSGAAEWLIRKKEPKANSIGVSLNIIGYLLLAFGVGQLTDSITIVVCILIAVASLVLLLSESVICVFLAVLVFNGSLIGLILFHNAHDAVHAVVIFLAAALVLVTLNEARLISKSPWFNVKYNPVRMGLELSLVITLGLLVHQSSLFTGIRYLWLSGLFLIGCLLYLVYRVMRDVGIISIKAQIIIYTCCILVLTPTVLTPSVPGALLVLLLSFYVGQKPGFWLGLFALVYFVIMYYYDLNMTLLVKSGVLATSGLLLLGGFVLLNKFLKNHAG